MGGGGGARISRAKRTAKIVWPRPLRVGRRVITHCHAQLVSIVLNVY